MIRYLTRRILTWVGMIFVATNATYFLAWAYLDPHSNFMGHRPPLTSGEINNILEPRNLASSVPLFERWWTWLTDILVHWDWGLSPAGGSVNDQIEYRIWVSAMLVLGATVFQVLIGVALGVFTASRQYSLLDRLGIGSSTVTMNIPLPVIALALVLGAIALNDAVGTHVLYVTGSESLGVEGFFPVLVDRLQHVLLPTIAIIFIGYSGYHLLQRTLLLDNIKADYVRTARAKGLTKQQAIRRHALRTSLIPVTTQVAFQIPAIFTGAVLTEKIFAWNGMGEYFITTLGDNDIHGVVAVAAFAALMTAIGALIADVAVVALDPRVRVS